MVFLAGIAEPSLPMNSGFVVEPISPCAEYFTLLSTIKKRAYVELDILRDVRPRTMDKLLSTNETGQG